MRAKSIQLLSNNLIKGLLHDNSKLIKIYNFALKYTFLHKSSLKLNYFYLSSFDKKD